MASAHALSSLSFQTETWIAPESLGSLRSGPENARAEGHSAQLKVRAGSAGQPASEGRALQTVASLAAQEDPAQLAVGQRDTSPPLTQKIPGTVSLRKE